jgi:hypothetical protein
VAHGYLTLNSISCAEGIAATLPMARAVAQRAPACIYPLSIRPTSLALKDILKGNQMLSVQILQASPLPCIGGNYGRFVGVEAIW